jgi:hypothetical protein
MGLFAGVICPAFRTVTSGTSYRLWEPTLLNEKISNLTAPMFTNLEFSVMNEIRNISSVDSNRTANLPKREAVFAYIFQKRCQATTPPLREKSHSVPARLNRIVEGV